MMVSFFRTFLPLLGGTLAVITAQAVAEVAVHGEQQKQQQHRVAIKMVESYEQDQLRQIEAQAAALGRHRDAVAARHRRENAGVARALYADLCAYRDALPDPSPEDAARLQALERRLLPLFLPAAA